MRGLKIVSTLSHEPGARLVEVASSSLGEGKPSTFEVSQQGLKTHPGCSLPLVSLPLVSLPLMSLPLVCYCSYRYRWLPMPPV